MRKLEIALAIVLFLAVAVIMNSCGSDSSEEQQQSSEQINPGSD